MPFNKDQKKLTSLYQSIYIKNKKRLLKEEDDIMKVDSVGRSGMSPKLTEAFNKKLEKAKDLVLKLDPFMYHIVSQHKVVPTYNTPTMAVTKNLNLRINPKFLLIDLTIPQAAAVLIHEAMHRSMNSFPRLQHRDRFLWNIATDYFINMYIHMDFAHLKIRLPKGVMMPSKIGDRYVIKKYKGAKLNNFDTRIGLDITELSAEALYEALLEIKNTNQKKKELDEDIKNQDKISQHFPEQKAPPQPLKIGDVVIDRENKTYGVVTSIDEKTGEAEYKKISKKEAHDIGRSKTKPVQY